MSTHTRPGLNTVRLLAAHLDVHLKGKRIDRLWRVDDAALLFKLSSSGGRRLLIDVGRAWPRCTLSERWPDTPSKPDQAALRFRAAIESARIAAVTVMDDRAIRFTLEKHKTPCHLHVQLAGRYRNIAAFDANGEEVTRLLRRHPASDAESPPLQRDDAPWPELDAATWLNHFDEDSWARVDAVRLAEAWQGIERALRKACQRARRHVAAVTRDLHKARDAAMLGRHGELLKSMLGRIPRGATSVSVQDYHEEHAPEVEIPLDPRLSAVENMEALFKRYRKYQRSQAQIATRLEKAKAHLERLDQWKEKVACARDHEDAADHLADITRELAPLLPRQTQNTRRRGTSQAGSPPTHHTFYAADGTEILVGKSARHNDALTFRVARGNDVWLHARDVPGSHVIVKCARGQSPSSAVLMDAALLAAHHSKSRNEALVDVMWTHRKHVRKAKGAAPGQVYVADARTITVRQDPDRLHRLYTERGPNVIESQPV